MQKSPPRMRGKRTNDVNYTLTLGITPADAGKTSVATSYVIYGKDHPRGCGENSSDNVKCSFDLGSPPRMRGKLKHISFNFKCNGITPADAGKTALPTGRSP